MILRYRHYYYFNFTNKEIGTKRFKNIPNCIPSFVGYFSSLKLPTGMSAHIINCPKKRSLNSCIILYHVGAYLTISVFLVNY